MPDISADALQAELTRLLRLASDARAANDVLLVTLATDEAAKCLVKLGDAQSALRVQEQQPPIGQQHHTNKGDTDR